MIHGPFPPSEYFFSPAFHFLSSKPFLVPLPPSFGHYIQNVGEEPLEFLEIFRGPNFGDRAKFTDFSLTQWLALNPPEVAARALNVSIDLVKELKKTKQTVVAGRQE